MAVRVERKLSLGRTAAGAAPSARSWRPVEAAERVLALCEAGLRAIADREGSDPATAMEVLLRWGAVGVFRVAWASRSRAGCSPCTLAHFGVGAAGLEPATPCL